jgi:sugar lactone lactonase YvrE
MPTKKNFFYLVFLLTTLSFVVSCSLFSAKSTSSATQPALPSPTEASQSQVVIGNVFQPTVLPTTDVLIQSENRRLWAVSAVTDSDPGNEEFLLGSPDEMFCESPEVFWSYTDVENSPTEITFSLSYAYAIKPSEINLYFTTTGSTTLRVEVLQASSGLGYLAYEDKIGDSSSCPQVLSIPLDIDQMVDTIIVAFNNQEASLYLDAVELAGTLPGYESLPVFWRVPVVSDDPTKADSRYPGGMALDGLNNLYLANGQNGLLRYDVEGNLLQSYTVPMESYISDIAVDETGKPVLTDSTYQWFVSLGPNGMQDVVGGEDFSWDNPREIAIHPLDGTYFLMDESEEVARIRVYNPLTAEWIRDIPLETVGYFAHRGLAFDQQGALYTIDQSQPGILKLDASSGEVIDILGFTDLAPTGRSDLALDSSGNIYVLLNNSPDNSAVYVLDPQGNLLKRFGQLTYDGWGWEEGTFLFPISIAVSADGQFVFIRENEFLTAYQWMP